MKNRKINCLGSSLVLVLMVFITTSCERELSDEAKDATLAKTAQVFTDDFAGMGEDFVKFYAGSNFQSFSVDRTQGYESSASIRINVPNASNRNGNYAGGIFVIDGAGRDLTGYNAITFWIKASRGVSIDQLGFGEDFGENKYMASLVNVNVETGWSKVIIPFPDPSKLTNVRGLFRYAAGTQGTSGVAYTFWIDEIKFEKLGTIANPQRSIQLGENFTINTYTGIVKQVKGIQTVFNMPDATNLSVVSAPGYFTFSSSNTNVAVANQSGEINVTAAGTSTITASFDGNQVPGSVLINSIGDFVHAPIPALPASNVISLFSNAYSNRPVNYFNGYWQPWQTSVSDDFVVNGDNILNYNIFNFVGIDYSSPTINATSMTHIHADFYFPGPIVAGRQLRVLVLDFGANGVSGGGDDTRHSTTFVAPTLDSQKWVSIDIAFSAMPNLASRANLGQIIFEGGDGSSLYVDNIFFYN